MKNFVQSGGISLAEFTSGAGVIVTNGTGILVSSTSSVIGGINVTEYTVTANVGMANIIDVNLTTLSDTQILQYDSTSEDWVNIDYTLDNLTDTDINTPVDGEVLLYDSGEWVNGYFSISNGADLLISGGGLQEFQILQWSGDAWENVYLTLPELEDVTINNVTLASGDLLYYNGTYWTNGALLANIGGNLSIQSTPVLNSSTAEEFLMDFSLDSGYAINHNVFEMEAHFDVTHTSDNTETVAIKLDNSITLASAEITSGSTWKVILKAKLVALTGDTCFFTDEVSVSSGRALESTISKYSATTSFTLGTEHTFRTWTNPGASGGASKISCNFFYVKFTK